MNRPRGALVPPHREVERAEGAGQLEQHQIDIGDYQIFVGEEQVGVVWVDPGPNPRETIEHWCLFENYRPPSPDNPRVTLELRYKEGLRDGHEGFASFVRTQEGARYVMAQCQEQAVD